MNESEFLRLWREAQKAEAEWKRAERRTKWDYDPAEEERPERDDTMIIPWWHSSDESVDTAVDDFDW